MSFLFVLDAFRYLKPLACHQNGTSFTQGHRLGSVLEGRIRGDFIRVIQAMLLELLFKVKSVKNLKIYFQIR